MATKSTGGEALPWVEIGRSASGDLPWTAWIVQEPPDTVLYRCLVQADGSAFVTIDLQREGVAQIQRLHSSQYPLPRDRGATTASIALLLEDADQAARQALRQAGGGTSRAA